MATYENASLWKNSLSKKLGEDKYNKQRDYFRVQYELFRDKARILASEINIDLPNYTVHDITHIDALWDMASIICGEKYDLNPAEAFVLGGAFLIHDLGMGLAAYPEGIDNLKKGVLWQDKFSYLKKKYPDKQEHQIEKDTLEIVLRELHAIHAEKLALISWGSTEKTFLIDDGNLRHDYGSIIGKIAHSHWWSIDDLIKKLPPLLGAPANLPNEWCIDPLKLACIMRVADAAHIDSLRAPAFLNRVRKLDAYSQLHWTFQQKLYQPRTQNEQLVYTSKSSFNADESASWWICYDTLAMISRELSNADMLLRDYEKPRFEVKSVAGIGNIEVISKLIETNGWKPVDAKIHVSQVVNLVRNLGGAQLYGDDYKVPLRELIQNGTDAIKARRLLEDEDSYNGKIVVRISKDGDGEYLEVEDNGVGMSERVISGPFLDFGTSFWGTSFMHEELPGLESKGFKSTGKFGVGFFSVFMIGEKVKVTSRRFEDARSDTKILTFDQFGLDRPLLRDAEVDEYLKEGGTKIRVYFKERDSLINMLDTDNDEESPSLNNLLEYMCPTLEVDLYCESYDEKREKIISANDWLTLDEHAFVKRLKVSSRSDLSNSEVDAILKKSSSNCEIIYENDMVAGRGFLYRIDDSGYKYSVRKSGVITVGGFRTGSINYIAGFLLGEVCTASRSLANPILSCDGFGKWLSNQAEKLKNEMPTHSQQYYAEALAALNIDCNGWKFINSKYGYLDLEEFKITLEKYSLKKIYFIQDCAFSNEERRYNSRIQLNDNIFIVSVGLPAMITTRSGGLNSDWNKNGFDFKRTLKSIAQTAFMQHWGKDIDDEYSWERKRIVIGKIENTEIMEIAEECEAN